MSLVSGIAPRWYLNYKLFAPFLANLFYFSKTAFQNLSHLITEGLF